jgi:aminopeptidase-like protein
MPIGDSIYSLAKELYPICRSISGNGVRDTLSILQREVPQLTLHEVPSGTQCFDWVIPPEWEIREAFIVGPDGNKVIDFKNHNLHVLGYSTPIDRTLSLDELQQHLYSEPSQPEVIPYVTSYYSERWGFCLSHRQRESLVPGDYRVYIDSRLNPSGSLTYGEVLLPGDSNEEIFISTYVCHPSMGNNELSGPTVATYIAKWLTSLERRRYTYRIVFIPETIGSICYLSRNLYHLKKTVVAGYNLTCIGDDRCYSYVASRQEDSMSDLVAQHVLRHIAPDNIRYDFLERGSDERQYNSPGIDLPIVTLMRSKFWTFPEYHTSADDMNLISPSGLQGGYELVRLCLLTLERNTVLRTTTLCEPNLGKRGLYPTLSRKGHYDSLRDMMNLLAYCDGTKSLLQIATKLQRPMWELLPTVEKLRNAGLLTESADKASP